MKEKKVTFERVAAIRWFSLIVLLVSVVIAPDRPALARPQALVDNHYVAPTGNDGGPNDCTNAAAPCLTIQAAISAASPDDLIYIAEGLYTSTSAEVVRINKSVSLLGGWDSTFTSQTTQSVIDGEGLRRGITVEAGVTAAIEHFLIRYGFQETEPGAGIWNAGVLTVDSSTILYNHSLSMGGGIYNAGGTLALNKSTLHGNRTGGQDTSLPKSGGGLNNDLGTVVIENSTFSNNTNLSNSRGSAIDNTGTLALNNSTVSGNLNGSAIYSNGNMSIDSSTIAYNHGIGIDHPAGSGSLTMRNSILAKNHGDFGDNCRGSLTSLGYNFIGEIKTYYPDCTVTAATGDQIGTYPAINPRLAPLGDYGGPTRTHALLGISPAIHAGTPNDCPATDQRGVARDPAVQGSCDIGAFEGYLTVVAGITPANANPSSAQLINFTVTFSQPVTGVDLVAPFDDFKLVTTGVTGAKVREVTGSGDVYNVKVYTGTGNGTIRLDLEDGDRIQNVLGYPLGGPGVGNGSKSGQTYTITRIPTPIAPKGAIWEDAPLYQWKAVPQATKYMVQAWKGAALKYSMTVSAGVCTNGTCSRRANSILPPGSYSWRIRAMTQGTWKSYSPHQDFVIKGPRAGFWEGAYPAFYVTPDRSQIRDFTIVIICNNVLYPITRTEAAPIIHRKFTYDGTFQVTGEILSESSAQGTVRLVNQLVRACGAYVTTQSQYWTAYWKSGAQPVITIQAPEDPFDWALPDLHGLLPIWSADTP